MNKPTNTLVDMTVGDVLERLCGVAHVVDGGASLFHDEFGHIISAIALTRWPDEGGFSAPVVWSTDELIPEQLAELNQRMFIRARQHSIVDGIAKAAIHVDGTLDDDMMTRIEQRLFSKVDGEPTINMPNHEGDKLTKIEALAWTYLFAIEDIHIFANRIIARRGQRIDTTVLTRFKEYVGELMYRYAMEPSSVSAPVVRDERQQIMNRCFDMLQLDIDDELWRVFGRYLSDERLGAWYDAFLPHFSALDAQGQSSIGQAFSQLSIHELRSLSVSTFIPERPDIDDLFVWIRQGEHVDAPDKWIGVLRYEDARSLWVITDIRPPTIDSSPGG